MSTEATRAATRAAAAALMMTPAPAAQEAPGGPTTPEPAQEAPAPVVGPEEVEEAVREDVLADVADVERDRARAREAIEAGRRDVVHVEVKGTVASTSAFVDSVGLMRSIRDRGLYPPGGAKRTLNLDLPADLAEDLAALLARHPGTNRTQVLRRLVEELVAGDGGPRRRRDAR